MTVNNVARVLQSLIERPTGRDLAAALGVGSFLLVAALLLMLSVRRRWLGLVLGAAGLATVIAALVIVDLQTTTIRESESVSVTRPRYRERTRAIARGTLIGLPGVAVLGALGAWASARRRIRLSVPGLLKAGRTHLFLKEFEPALAHFDRAIRISPFLADAYCGRAAAHDGLGHLDRALADYDRAIQCDPRLTHARLQRARIRTHAGDIDGALADLDRVMEIQPSDPELYLNRGICYVKKGLANDATADFHRVLKLTNHSDFAEPAREFLLRLEQPADAFPSPPPMQPLPLNGQAEPDSGARNHSI